MTSRCMWRLCNGPKTPAQWKSEIVTDRVMEIISQFMEVIFWFMEESSGSWSYPLGWLVLDMLRHQQTFGKFAMLFKHR